MKIRRLLYTEALLPTLLIRLAVGAIFLSEGIQKYIFPELVGAGRFAQIGFSNPEFWADFTGFFEIFCGLFILFGLLTRFASIPLLIIMFVAFITTKLPLLVHKGFWAMAHDYRTDFTMTVLLAFLLIYGGGSLSLDRKFFKKHSV